MKINIRLIPIILGIALSSCQVSMPDEVAEAYEQLPEKVDFNFHIRPILSDRCFQCHGPDQQTRKAELRLDLEEEAFKALASGNGHAIVSGSPARSQIVDRILSEEPEWVMPTPESKLTLTAEEKALIIKWIDQGAEWKDHWAFTPPLRPETPKPINEEWAVYNPIDLFIQQRLQQEGLSPAPEADKEKLIRRVYLDLTGLPPTLEEIDAFLADDSEEAYEKVVDRLLASKAGAERLAMEWMDLSRYADSHGMHADGWREMWQWRDWVINSFHKNTPYDQFATWQLAGDLMPDASKDQILATAFNRNHPMTAEGGVIDEEFRLGYVFDRTETVSTAFMGLTIGCARCHDHKFDPVSQEEYYQTAAFFNNIKELGMTGDDGNYGPMLMMADSLTDQKIREIKAKIDTQESELTQKEKQLAESITPFSLSTSGIPKGWVGRYSFEKVQKRRNNNRDQWYFDGNTKVTSGVDKKLVEGRKGSALSFSGDYDEVYIAGVANFELYEPYSAAAWINTSKHNPPETQVIMGTAGVKNNFWRGWDLYLDTLNRPTVRLISSLPHNYIHIRSRDAVQLNTWTHIAFSYDGSSKATGLKLYVEGKEIPAVVEFDKLYKSILPVSSSVHEIEDRAIRIGKSYRAFTGEDGLFEGKIDEIIFYDRELLAPEIAQLAGISANFNNEDSKLILARQKKDYQQSFDKLQELRKDLLDVLMPVPEVMVMEEMPEPKTMFVYNRGEYDAPLYPVETGTPSSVLEFPEGLPKNRLGLSQWIFSDDHPLTARVTVNRYWQLLFGRGIVNTPQDFGVQGELPSHPALLDWLAVEFHDSGWDLRHMLKLMVMSATYRQSSVADKDKMDNDPLNILLARASSYRLPAEFIRDNALAASGLLNKEIGGKSVFPYQPEGLWIEKGNFSHVLLRYKESEGDDLYRRSMYTFIKRTSPPPFMTVFDVPNRDVCTVKREVTNTPLQALVLLNDPQYVEAARVLAQRVQNMHKSEISAQIRTAFRLVTGRKLNDKESELFQKMFDEQMERFAQKPQEAKELLAVGDYPLDKSLDPQRTAALTMIASTMLNHDEAYMKR